MNREDRLALDGWTPADLPPILFYHPRELHGWASNFSDHGFYAWNPWLKDFSFYKTGEHRYQAMKATNGEDHELIRNVLTPKLSKNIGREIQLRDGWGQTIGDLCWYVMFETVLEKARQNADVQRALRSTENAKMYEDSPVDPIWGWRKGNDYSGQNLLGLAWMEARRFV